MGLESFIPPRVEFTDHSVVLRGPGGELRLRIKEFMRLGAHELADRLGYPRDCLKELFMWKREVVEDYVSRQPLRDTWEFTHVTLLWAKSRPVYVGDELVGWDDEYKLWLAHHSYRPPIIIYDRDGYVNPRRHEYALVRLDRATLTEVVQQVPRRVLDRLLKLLQEWGFEPPERRRGRDEADYRDEVANALFNAGCVMTPVPVLRDVEFLRSMDWRSYVEEQVLSYKADVDPRLKAVRAAHVLRGVEPRYLPHAILVGNSGSGKSQFYKVWGTHRVKVTANSLIGYARGRDEVYPGLIKDAEEPIAVDQVESQSRAALAQYLYDYMEDGTASFTVGGVDYRQHGRAPLVFIANPLGMGGEKDFRHILDIISFNPALGGRIALIFYFTDLREIRGTGEDLQERDLEEWLRAKRLVRAVEDYARRELRRIWRHPRVLDWLNTPVPGYRERVSEIVEGLEDEPLREFLMNHGGQAHRKLRGAALQVAILYNLDRITLGEYSIDEILGEAEEWLRRYVELNLASIANIIREYEGKREANVRAFYESLPDYLKAVVAVAEAYRRAILEEWRGRGQVPDGLRTLVLDELKLEINVYGYRYLSQALDRVKRRRRAERAFPAIDEYLGLKLTLREVGPLRRVELIVRKWEEAPIDVPAHLIKAVRGWLREPGSPVLQFLHFSSLGERDGVSSGEGVAEGEPRSGQQPAGARGAGRQGGLAGGGENGEKMESSPLPQSHQITKTANEAGRNTPSSPPDWRNGETGELEKPAAQGRLPLGTDKMTKTAKVAKTCGSCRHFRGLKCLKHPEWTVVSPEAGYAERCEYYEPRLRPGISDYG